jgi:hypothetical protein
LILLGFFGLNPVLVANENLVTQLSNFFAALLLAREAPLEEGYGMGLAVVTSRVIEARSESSLSRLLLDGC